MSFRIKPLNSNILVKPLTPKEVKEVTAKQLVDLDSNNTKVLNYGRVLRVGMPSLSTLANLEPLTVSDKDPVYPFVKDGDIVLYQKLASHITNFGNESPREVLVPVDYIEAVLEVIND